MHTWLCASMCVCQPLGVLSANEMLIFIFHLPYQDAHLLKANYL